MEINVFVEDIEYQFNYLSDIQFIVERISDFYSVSFEEINLIFCSDDYLLGINKQYLHKDYLTDIITFPYDNPNQTISTDIFISIDRVTENAELNRVSFVNELFRVMIHGCLHLCGLNDKSESEIVEMRSMENKFLGYLNISS